MPADTAAELTVELIHGGARITPELDAIEWVRGLLTNEGRARDAIVATMTALNVSEADVWEALAGGDHTAQFLAAAWGPATHLDVLGVAGTAAVHFALMHNPATTTELIARYVPHFARAVEYAAVAHPNCGPATLRHLAETYGNPYDAAIVAHPNATPEVLDALARNRRRVTNTARRAGSGHRRSPA